MDNIAYPVYLSSQTADELIPEKGKFFWNLDNKIVSSTLRKNLYIQLYNIQISRQFPNVYGEGRTLTFFHNNLPNVKYTKTIAEGYYQSVADIISAYNGGQVVRVDTGQLITNPITFAYDNNASRILTVDNTHASLDLTIEPTGLALRLGICNSPLEVPHVLVAPNLTKTKGTWDILFPKQIYITSGRSLQMDVSNDSAMMANRKIIASVPMNSNYGDIIEFERPFIIQPLKNLSVENIDIAMTDENFTPLPFHNTFALTFMFYKN
jgi:hypothetical protein